MSAQEPSGLPLKVYQQIEKLKRIQKDLKEQGDRHKQLPNVEALFKAYREGRLEWCEGLVTYWSNGEQMCQPRPFDWDELEAFQARHQHATGFWAEGVFLPN